MSSKNLGVCLSVFLIFYSCGDEARNMHDNSGGNNVNTTPTPLNKIGKIVSEEEREGWEIGSYSTLLKNYVPIDSLVFVGEKTIRLEDLSILNDLTNVSQETINNFIEKNKTSKKIKKHFDVYAKIDLIKVSDSIDVTLKLIKEKYPKSEGIILLSKIGTNNDSSQTLIYMEHYDLSGDINKQFCITSEDNGKVKNVEWFPVKQ